MGVMLEAMIERQTGTHGTTTKIKGNRKHRLRSVAKSAPKTQAVAVTSRSEVERRARPLSSAAPSHSAVDARPARFARRASIVLAQRRNDYDLIAK